MSRSIGLPLEIRRFLYRVAWAAAALVGACQQPESPPAVPLHSVWEAPPPARSEAAVAAPATSGPADPPIASVNGEAIGRGALVEELLATHGLDVLEKLMVTAALRQKAEALGITITPADVQAEYDDALRRIAGPVASVGTSWDGAEAGGFDRRTAEEVLNDFLAAKNVSRAEYMMRMRQNAYLRKLAQREVKVDDAALPDEYERAYGEKVLVRCIQVSSPEKVKQVRAALDDGKDFELIARQMSENRYVAARGGLLPPFTRYDDVPRLLRDAAFALRPGEVSSTIHENEAFYIIRLEKRFAASQVGIENVKDQLRARLRDRLVRERMDRVAAEVFNAAAIRIYDPAMREAFRRRYPEANVSE